MNCDIYELYLSMFDTRLKYIIVDDHIEVSYCGGRYIWSYLNESEFNRFFVGLYE